MPMTSCEFFVRDLRARLAIVPAAVLRSLIAALFALASAFVAAQTATRNAPETFDGRLLPAIGALERGDFTQAVESLKPVAASGSVEARYLLGIAYELAPDSAGGVKAARAVYLEAARAGHPGAQNNLGAMLIDGRGGDRDEIEAARWYAQAAAQGSLEGQYNLALLHGRGRGVARDDAEMARLLTLAAEQGYARAQAQLGRLYLDGVGVRESPPLAKKWIEAAARQGHVGAQHILGTLYQKGIGTARDFDAALAWFTRSAQSGNRAAMEEVAKIHELGLGTPADPVLAAEWRAKAAGVQPPRRAAAPAGRADDVSRPEAQDSTKPQESSERTP